jgi:hypothetical protein
VDSVPDNLSLTPGNDYTEDKSKILRIRNTFSTAYRTASDTTAQNRVLNSAMVRFTELLLNTIIPYWYGTPWDFNGYTAIPNQGTIACGYFVSTTLRDMGLQINRYTLAQQGPENEARSIAVDTAEMRSCMQHELHDELENRDEGLYFIGLTHHVGYLYIYNNAAYFIHSNYIDGTVMIENTEYSKAFHSTHYYLTPITGNTHLIKKWLKKDDVPIITQ